MTAAQASAIHPLTSLQKSMVLALLRAPRSGAYVIQDICELEEQVDGRMLETAWNRVSERHNALRTSVAVNADNQLEQHVHHRPEVSWTHLDWRSVGASAQLQKRGEFLAQDRERGFTFDDSVPMRFALIRKSERASTLIWTVHHVLLDGRSLAIVWQEWFAIYDAMQRGEFPALDAPPPFYDHPAWLQTRDSPAIESFWRSYFAGMSETTGFVTDRLMPAEDGPQEGVAKQRLQLSKQLTEELSSFASLNGLTINTLVQGAWALLLARYSGKTEVVFGATRAGRSSPEGANSRVGMLINTLPVRIATPPGALLLPWLQQIREQWVALREFEHTPLDRVWEWSGLPPGTPPFDNVLVYDHEPIAEAMRNLGGNWQHRTLTRIQRTDSSLTLAAYGNPLLTLEIIYGQRLFASEFVAAMTGHLSTLLTSFVRQSGRPLAELKMLTAHEERWLTQDLNQTQTPYPRDICSHRLFEQQAARIPDHAAFDTAGGEVSYGELNRRANRLAWFLHEKGAGPEDFVAVCMARSPLALTAVLAVTKTGAAFLPLDPRLPLARLAAMLEGARAKFVLTDDANLLKLASCGRHVLNAGVLEGELSNHSAENLPNFATPDNAAYAIYTSGSTGKPKAVVVTHQSLVNYVLGSARVYGISDSDRRIQFASLGADFFVAEVFNHLSAGVTLVFCMDPNGNSVAEYLRMLDQHRITITGIPSSWWHQWISTFAEAGSRQPRSLRALITGMEQVNPAALQTWKRVAGSGIRWFNAYGPTETTCTSAFYEAGSSEYEGGQFVPIGRPFPNTRLYVLDSQRNPVPIGVPGELYIGGAGVARGYLNSPELTAERFLPDPFHPDPGGRMYRTGDQVFYLPDGHLVFLGRLDRQVKIRGFRIELDEIEAVLARHPSVRECAVVVRGEDYEQSLVAYLTAATGSDPRPEDLHHHVSAHLPAHMIPAAFVVLPKLPLTLNGKIDRQSLRSVESEPARAERALRPLTPTEQRVAHLWRKALGVPVLESDANFFLLGGNSLKAAQLILLIQNEFGKELPFVTVFQAPTLSRIAAILDNPESASGQTDADWETVVPLQPHGSLPPLFCISPTVEDPYAFRLLSMHLGAAQPVFAVLNLPAQGERLPTVEELAARAAHAIRRARPAGPYILGGYCFGGTVAYETARQLRSVGEDVRMIALFDTPAPGYPKLLRGHRRNWRRLRGSRIGVREIISHLDRAGYLIKRNMRGRTERSLVRLEGVNLVPAVDAVERWQERSASMYVPKQTDVPIAQFMAQDEPVSTTILDDPRLGWREISGSEFQVHPVGGSHGTLLGERHAPEVARILSDLLRPRASGLGARDEL